MKILLKTYLLSKTTILSKTVLSQYINLFWSDIFNPIHSSNNSVHLMLMIKVQFTDSTMGYRTLGNLRKVNFNDKELFIEFLTANLGFLTDSYKVTPFSKITFSYIVKDGLADDTRLLLQTPVYEVTTHNYTNRQLPLTMEPGMYGKVLGKEVLPDNKTRHIVLNNGYVFYIDVSEDLITNNVHIQAPIDLKWIDTKISDNTFKRVIGKNTIFIENGSVLVNSKELNARAFSTVKVDSKLDPIDTFMTIDIEAVRIDDKIQPYLICGYSNGNYIHSYASDTSLDAQKDMMNSFIKQLLEFKKIKCVYAHNLSGFDGILLLKHLIKYTSPSVMCKVEPLIFNEKLISIKFIVGSGKNARTIIFKDSFLLLPNSLRKLCDAFSVPTIKSHFPFLLTDINYIGEFPKFEHWTGISISEYNTILSKHSGLWIFKDEAIKYCKLDCKCLYDILVKFNDLVFNEFKINITKVLTLPSLAMKIYKSQYMPKNTIYQILGNVEKDIRESYTGGAVDVYRTSNKVWDHVQHIYTRVKLYYYDVNSLYPTIMKNVLMPTGKPIAFEGDIRKVEPDAYGFFYCKITSPKYLHEPILQRRIKTKDGNRTVAGLGTWTGWIFSLEMDKAIKFGYEFEIIRGYKFKAEVIFKEYVEKMYSLRLQYPKDHPMNLIAKLLMNSLYGKFGMRPEHSLIDMFDRSDPQGREDMDRMLDLYGESLHDYVQLDDHFITVRKNFLSYSYSEANDMFFGLDVNIGIASAITAGGRMWMSLVKNNPNFNLYYSDTDSAVIDKELPPELVGNKLGQFKLECTIDSAAFLAPKVYALKTSDGQEVIKVKGLTKDVMETVTFQQIENLLIKDSRLVFTQEKWFKLLFNIEYNISVATVAYQLAATSTKRKAIWDMGVFTHTIPYFYKELEGKIPTK